MILLKEVIGIKSHEKEYIRNSVNLLRSKFEPYKQSDGYYRLIKLKYAFESLNKCNYFREEKFGNINIKFYMNWNKSETAQFVWDYTGKNNCIYVNLAHMFSVKRLEDKNWWVTKIDYNQIQSSITHEFTHFLQLKTVLSKSIDPFKSKKSYMNRGYEHGAWAAGELERIRQELEPFSYGKKLLPKILYILRNHGITGSILTDLKENNPMAWKKIMKKVVLMALSDSEFIK